MDTTDRGEMVCRPGGMELSRPVQLRLLAWMRDEDPPSGPFTFRIGGRWHCPSDGARLHEADGVIACPRCARHLSGGLVYRLVEFHQHAAVPD